jgi:hypothetical protein
MKVMRSDPWRTLQRAVSPLLATPSRTKHCKPELSALICSIKRGPDAEHDITKKPVLRPARRLIAGPTLAVKKGVSLNLPVFQLRKKEAEQTGPS